MPVPPCLAYLLDTPDEPGVVVTYRCSRPAGHAPAHEHRDDVEAVSWTATEDVAWAPGAVYPHHTGYPWDDEDSPALHAPPITTTPAPTDPEPDGKPWARVRADARAARATKTRPAEELS